MDSGRYVPSDPKVIRRATDKQLHAMLAGDDATKAARIALEREQRRREAWAAPAGRAYWISVAALLVAAGSLVATILRT